MGEVECNIINEHVRIRIYGTVGLGPGLPGQAHGPRHPGRRASDRGAVLRVLPAATVASAEAIPRVPAAELPPVVGDPAALRDHHRLPGVPEHPRLCLYRNRPPLLPHRARCLGGLLWGCLAVGPAPGAQEGLTGSRTAR